MRKLSKTNSMFRLWALACLIGPLTLILSGEVVKLKDGAWLKGKILKQNQSVVIMDLGYDVIRIPRSEVADISITDHRETSGGPGAASPYALEEDHPLYTAKALETLTVADSAGHSQEAVVLVRSPGGQGSGFLINKQGYIITNFHVIEGQKHINITRYKQQGAELKNIVHQSVRIVALDSFHDLAVLQLENNIADLPEPAILSPEDTVEPGEKVFVIGNPMGLERTITEGVISHPGRLFSGKVYLQLDAATNPGNSGGPLFNSRGQVIGVMNMGAPLMQGLNFAIPVRQVKFLLRHIDTFAYNETNPISGYIYPFPPRNPQKKTPPATPSPEPPPSETAGENHPQR